MWSNQVLGTVLDRDGPDPDRAWVRRQRSARPRDRRAPQRPPVSASIQRAHGHSVERCGPAAASATWRGRCRRATIVGVACNGYGRDSAVFPEHARACALSFSNSIGPAIDPEESPQQYSTRLLAQVRQRAPIEVAGRKRARGARWPRPHVVAGDRDHRQARWQGPQSRRRSLRLPTSSTRPRSSTEPCPERVSPLPPPRSASEPFFSCRRVCETRSRGTFATVAVVKFPRRPGGAAAIWCRRWSGVWPADGPSPGAPGSKPASRA